ncbi:hypothetical protein SAMN02799624_04271 [Paenibacillus sp. UNC496MF]|uniref:hypothetical protein n=1 Tax=Paenibacillus sp. UNC496MF TaxID=1502753 RepID=UPI0008E19E03|nr:hypothetical protein [Paenibacillus sp. UNC496MF]SFJ36467.1 hypothetical protein SAMN02799624_04271 [Paenibacillus sp. UNC496MF]
MSRMRPWVKKALLASVIVVAVGVGFGTVTHERGSDVTKVVRVNQELPGRPAGGVKVEIRGGEGAAVPPPPGAGAAIPVPPIAPMLREGGTHIERGHAHGIGPGIAAGGALLLAGALLFWMSSRGKRARVADGANGFAGIPSASDFLDQWELQQNQTKESK